MSRVSNIQEWWVSSLSKPAKQVWYWASRVYTKNRIDQIPCECMYVRMYVCNYSSQTTEPIYLKMKLANTVLIAIGYLHLKYLPPPYLKPSKNPKGAWTGILKPNKHNIETHISRPRFVRFRPNLARWCSSTLLTIANVQNFKFRKSKMAAAAIWKKRKSPYLGHSSSDFDEIWHTDTLIATCPGIDIALEGGFD